MTDSITSTAERKGNEYGIAKATTLIKQTVNFFNKEKANFKKRQRSLIGTFNSGSPIWHQRIGCSDIHVSTANIRSKKCCNEIYCNAYGQYLKWDTCTLMFDTLHKSGVSPY